MALLDLVREELLLQFILLNKFFLLYLSLG